MTEGQYDEIDLIQSIFPHDLEMCGMMIEELISLFRRTKELLLKFPHYLPQFLHLCLLIVFFSFFTDELIESLLLNHFFESFFLIKNRKNKEKFTFYVADDRFHQHCDEIRCFRQDIIAKEAEILLQFVAIENIDLILL